MGAKITQSYPLNKMSEDYQKALEISLKEQLLVERNEIENRTRGKHLDVNGSPFKAYQGRYKKGQPVDLYGDGKKGHMLAAMKVGKVRKGKRSITGSIYFSNSEAAKKARWNMETRKFFGLSEKQLREFARNVRVRLQKKIRR